MNYAELFGKGHTYEDFLQRYGTGPDRQRWQAVLEAVKLTPEQRGLLGNFKRTMNVVCLAGAWCGDCANQCPIFEAIQSASPPINIRFFDRDDHPELAKELAVCGGARVPAVLFLSEDFLPCGRYGDRTLARYRELGGQLMGAACSTGIVSSHRGSLDLVVQDWINEFERVQWMLRLSPRLRALHGD